MEKITVSKIVKTKPGKFGMSVMVKTNEYGDNRIYMMTVKDPASIVPGKSYEGEASLWKEGDDGTGWWSWKWPKKESGGGMTEEQWVALNRKLDTINTDIKRIIGVLLPLPAPKKSFVPSVAEMDFTPAEDSRIPPAESYDKEAESIFKELEDDDNP